MEKNLCTLLNFRQKNKINHELDKLLYSYLHPFLKCFLGFGKCFFPTLMTVTSGFSQ